MASAPEPSYPICLCRHLPCNWALFWKQNELRVPMPPSSLDSANAICKVLQFPDSGDSHGCYSDGLSVVFDQVWKQGEANPLMKEQLLIF